MERTTLKVLHVWDQAGVGSLIAKTQRDLLGWDSHLIIRYPYDPYGIVKYYGGEIYRCPASAFKAISLFKSMEHDIAHIHSLDTYVPMLSRIRPTILHYHGSDIRGKWAQRRPYWEKARQILVSTPDLLEGAPTNVTYLPNPVDTDLLTPRPELRVEGTAVHLIANSQDIAWARSRAEKMNLRLTLLRREFKYEDMVSVLSPFEYLIDRTSVKSLSKTALEALACGLKVVAWNCDVVYELPKEHKPENVTVQLRNLIEHLR